MADPLHHPFIEVVQHLISPLTSSIVIFGVYKASHIPKIKAWARAHFILKKAKYFPRTNPKGLNTYSSPIDTTLTKVNKKSFHSMALSSPSISRIPMNRNSSFIRHSPMINISAARKYHQGANNEAINQAHRFFPDSWYVKSPFTDNMIVFTSEKMEHIINAFHVELGLPWWQCMVGLTLFFRIVVLPLNVGLVRNTLRLYKVKPAIAHLNKKIQDGNQDEKVEASKELIQVLKENKCHPMKNILSPILFPAMFLSLFGAIYDFSTGLPDASTSGTLWFMDISKPDPTFVLPVISALTWLATIEMASGEYFPLKPWMLSATRLVSVAFIPVSMNLPSGVFLFWITSNVFACTRAWVVRQPVVARLCGIPTREEIRLARENVEKKYAKA